MSRTNDQDMIDAVTRRGQILVAVLIVGVVFMLGLSIVLDPLGTAQRRAVAGAGPGAAQGKAADAIAVPRPAIDSVDPVGEIITWVAVAFAGMLVPLSFVVPGRGASQNRRSIAAGTWSPPPGQNPPGPAVWPRGAPVRYR